MASTAAGHKQDASRGTKPVKIDEELWAQCRALGPCIGRLPAFLGEVDGCEVYVVDAMKIMLNHDMDFTQGGNHEEDPKLCGKHEIVLDDSVRADDWPFICYHEAYERMLMIKGVTYDAAHKVANAHEKQLRQLYGRKSDKPPAMKPATKVAGYVQTPTPKQCATCEYLEGTNLCRQEKVQGDAQLTTDRRSGLKVVDARDGCCNFWEPDTDE